MSPSVGTRPAWYPIDPLELLAFHHAAFGDARMDTETGGEGAAGAGTGDGGAGAGAGAGSGKTYTDAELNAIAARAEARGKEAAEKAAAEKLGMSVEDGAKNLKAADDARKAAMDEATRKQIEADEAKATAEKATAAANAEKHTTIVERTLRAAGLAIPDKDGDAFVTMALGLVAAKVGDDEAAIKTAVERVKAMAPALFTKTETTTGGGGGSDPGTGPNGRQQSAGSFGKEGVEEFERRFPKAKASA